MKARIVALLPMKANSERVKGKNFRNFNGKPLFKWVLETLLSIDEIDTVVINTDAKEILAQKGLTGSDRLLIRDRKPEICGDLVSMNLILADDIENIDADIYLMTHTTNPFLSAVTIRSALTAFLDAKDNNKVDSLFTVDKVQTRFYLENGTPVNHDPSNLVRTQDLEPWYEENSNLYIFTRSSFLQTNARIGKNAMLFETPKFESLDIDTPEDWDFGIVVADYLMRQKV